MTERFARCFCGATEPSSNGPHLAFFEDRGPGSEWAARHCTKCGYAVEVHQAKNRSLLENRKEPHLKNVCDDFTPGPHKYDSYYDGCRGWD